MNGGEIRADDELANYGLSGPLFRLLKRLDVPCQLDDIDESLARKIQEGKQWQESLFECANENEVELEIREFDLERPSDIKFPSIVVREENDGAAVVGSLLLAVSRNEDDSGMIVYEFRQGKGWLNLPDGRISQEFQNITLVKRARSAMELKLLLIGIPIVALFTMVMHQQLKSSTQGIYREKHNE